MKSIRRIRTEVIVLAAIAATALLTSCDSRSDGGRQLSAEVEAEGRRRENALDEKYEAKFQSVLDSTNRWGAYMGELGKLEDEVLQLSNDKSLPIMEKFMDMTIAAQPPPVDHDSKTNPGDRYAGRNAWFEKMYWVFRDVFHATRLRQNEPYDNWEKLFVFLGKYTNEIASLEQSLMAKEDRATRRYMNDLKGQLRTYVDQLGRMNVMLRADGVGATNIKIKPTEDQRAALLARFEEFKTFTDYKSTMKPCSFSTPQRKP